MFIDENGVAGPRVRLASRNEKAAKERGCSTAFLALPAVFVAGAVFCVL
jgi:hypothetical protein